MSTNTPYPPGNNQPPYPTQQPITQYPPDPAFNYGSAGGYPPPSNQAAYPPPVETVPYPNPAFPPPPTYESAVGTGGKPAAPNTYGNTNYSYQTQPIPPVAPATFPSSYATPDVEYGRSDGSEYSGIIDFSDKSIRLGKIAFIFDSLIVRVIHNVPEFLKCTCSSCFPFLF